MTFQSWTGCISNGFQLPFLPLNTPLSSLPSYPRPPLILNILRTHPHSSSCTLSSYKTWPHAALQPHRTTSWFSGIWTHWPCRFVLGSPCCPRLFAQFCLLHRKASHKSAWLGPSGHKVSFFLTTQGKADTWSLYTCDAHCPQAAFEPLKCDQTKMKCAVVNKRPHF